LEQEVKPGYDAHIYMTEYFTPTYQCMAGRYAHVVGSEYFGPDHAPGSSVNWVRHEDLENLSFADEGLDAVLCFDVLEHVPNPNRALGQLYRCLKPGGALLLSVPFLSDRNEWMVRARLDRNGQVDHLLPAEYHGNPTDPEGGALVFQIPGWGLLDDMAAVGFVEPMALYYWSSEFAYLGTPNLLFLARKLPA
jgi:SAM-dependent methyltransferase